MKDICLKYRITEEEYANLNREYGKLCWKAAHELKRKNTRNNFTDDAEDIYQELVSAMLRAGSYTKRQNYIEKCLNLAKNVTGVVIEKGEDGEPKVASAGKDFTGWIVAELCVLWANRKRHGANRQKFGPYQEAMLDRIIERLVPAHMHPSASEPLKMDDKFGAYCKAIVWNGQKSMGKKITREKAIRSGQVSLSEYDWSM